MKLYRLIIFLLAMVFCINGFAQAKAKTKKTDSEEEERKVIKVKTYDNRIIEIDVTNDLDDFVVEKHVEDLKKLIKEDLKGKKAPWAQLAFLSDRMCMFSYHPQIEETTKIYKKWYRDLSKCLKVMSDTKSQFYLIQNRRDPKKRAEIAKKYTAYKNKLIKILKNPARIKDNPKKR